MKSFLDVAKEILENYDYLEYRQIVKFGLSKGILKTDGKTPEFTMSSRLSEDIRKKGIKSDFIKVGEGIFALRKELDEDNLLVYLKYRLKGFDFWKIDDKDKKYLFDMFGKDVFEKGNEELLSLLNNLGKKRKITGYNVIDNKVITITFVKEKIEISRDLEEQIKGSILCDNEGRRIIGNYTHTFEGYLQEGDFTTIRGYASIQDLANISEAIYFDAGGSQRKENEERCEKIKKYIESGSKRFFPEVILGLYIGDDVIKIENSIKGDDKKKLKGLSQNIKTIYIDLSALKNSKSKISRIDGNHRLFFADKIKDDFKVPFCFVVFWEKDLEQIYKNQEANIFYLLNGKNKPVTSEEALQVLLNMPDEEAKSLYQNDSTLGLTRLCKEKYDSFCEIPGTFKDNFGELPYTKFEKLIIKIEKLNIESDKIDEILNSIFETIHPLGSKYERIIKREDFLGLVLEVVLDNPNKEAGERNMILRDFFDWILKEGLEEISSSEKPILWELSKKQKSFRETYSIHNYQINEYKFDGSDEEVSYKEFIDLLNESRKKITEKELVEKRIGLEKIVDAYEKLLDILGGGKSDNRQRVESMISRFFHSSNKAKMKVYLQCYFYDNLGNRVMNNDFAIRHHQVGKERLEDEQFIELLYCEYDNAIRFILSKAGFLK